MELSAGFFADDDFAFSESCLNASSLGGLAAN